MCVFDDGKRAKRQKCAKIRIAHTFPPPFYTLTACLNKELDRQVQAYLYALWDKGAVVNSAIVRACAEGVVNSNLLLCNGGYM